MVLKAKMRKMAKILRKQRSFKVTANYYQTALQPATFTSSAERAEGSLAYELEK